MRPSCVQLNLSPQNFIELFPDIKQVVLISVVTDKLVNERLVKLMVMMLGMCP